MTALPVPGVAAARRRATGRRLPRLLHPVAWWVWAFGMAGAAIETTDPVLLVLLGTVVTFVVALRRSSAPWARSFTVYLRLAVIVVTLQVVFEILFGQRIPGRVLFSFPHVPLPGWAQGVSVGGPVTAEGLAGAAVRGVRVAVVLLCFGAANTLASPYRLLRSLPTVLYEAGVGVTVALAFAPEVINALAATRRARRLRGRPTRGPAGLRGMGVPVLEGALDRSVQLAASMDARGYGRTSPTRPAGRRLAGGCCMVGLLATAGGLFIVLDGAPVGGAGVVLLVAGAASLAAGLFVGSRQAVRTRYRPDPWRLPEWIVSLSGLAVLAAFVVVGAVHPGALQPPVSPLRMPSPAPVAALAVFLGLLPAVAAPPPEPVTSTEPGT